MEADKILKHLGGYDGRYQILVFVMLAFVYMRGSWPVLGSIFLGGDPGHHCKVPSNVSLNESVPGKVDSHGVWTADKCKMYVPGSGRNQTESCVNGYEYGPEFESTILSEWDLVCDKDYLSDLSTTIYMVGNACGALFLAPLSDKFGRKKIILYFLWIQAVIGVGAAFAPDYITFTVLRFLIGLFNMPIALTTYIMITEVFASTHRALPSVAVNCFWGIGLMFLALFGYFVRNWQYLQLLITLPNFLTIVYYWFLPESISWLIANGEYEKAEKVSKYAAKINNITLPQSLFVDDGQESDRETTGSAAAKSDQQLMRNVRENRKYNVLDLFKTPRLRRYTFIMFYLWLANSLSYFGILFATPSLHGNQFLNLGISGIVEIPALFICMFLMQVMGRRKPHMFFLLLCGILNIVVIFVPEKTESGTDLSALVVFLAMVGKFGITGSYSICYLYSSEIFPTVVRNQAVGLSSFFENLGGIAAPLIIYGTSSDSMKKLPLGIFGGISLLGGILCYFLPETHKCALPVTIEDIENLVERQKYEATNEQGGDTTYQSTDATDTRL